MANRRGINPRVGLGAAGRKGGQVVSGGRGSMHGLGGLPVIDQYCADKARSMLSKMDNDTIVFIATYWPPDVFTWEQVGKTIDGLLKMSKITTDLIRQVRVVYDTPALAKAENDIYSTIGAKANQLIADKAPVSGYDMKNWVVQSFFACSNGMKAVIAANCEKPWILEFFEGYQAGFDKVWNLLSDVGDGIKKTPDLLAKIWTAMKWGSIAYGSYWVYTNFFAKKKPSS